ncbi:MAG: MerR family transcriptional regulator [Thermochromatium sp.]
MSTSTPYLSISAVEREIGLSKDVLRKWEGRYGFPRPLRDEFGERIYPPEQVNRLRLIKRLMDTGVRPSGIVGKNDDELLALAASRHVTTSAPHDRNIETTALDLLRRHDPKGLRQTLYRLLLRQGLASFVQDTITPLNHAVGEAWSRGELEIYEEHLYTEAVQWVLRNALAGLTDRHGTPRVLLTTLPEEPHRLGILMVAAMLALEGGGTVCPSDRRPRWRRSPTPPAPRRWTRWCCPSASSTRCGARRPWRSCASVWIRLLKSGPAAPAPPACTGHRRAHGCCPPWRTHLPP